MYIAWPSPDTAPVAIICEWIIICFTFRKSKQFCWVFWSLKEYFLLLWNNPQCTLLFFAKEKKNNSTSKLCNGRLLVLYFCPVILTGLSIMMDDTLQICQLFYSVQRENGAKASPIAIAWWNVSFIDLCIGMFRGLPKSVQVYWLQ